jgi:putative endonuclease
MAKAETKKRQNARRYGLWSEHFAAIFLRLKGYRILARNFRTKVGEIDIIARKGDLVAIIEVKARPDVLLSVNSVSFTSRKRIANAANWWLSRQGDGARISLRFDIVAVRPFALPVHLEDAF